MRHAIPRSGGGADPRAAVRRTAERTGVGQDRDGGGASFRVFLPSSPPAELGDSTARDRGRYSPAVNARSAMSIAPERVRSNLIAIRVTFVRSIPENRSRGTELLQQHVPHEPAEPARVAKRLGAHVDGRYGRLRAGPVDEHEGEVLPADPSVGRVAGVQRRAHLHRVERIDVDSGAEIEPDPPARSRPPEDAARQPREMGIEVRELTRHARGLEGVRTPSDERQPSGRDRATLFGPADRARVREAIDVEPV